MYVAISVPAASVMTTSEPAVAVPDRAVASQPCAESVEGATIIPELPVAIRVPPVISKVPLTSSAPLPSVVGP